MEGHLWRPRVRMKIATARSIAVVVLILIGYLDLQDTRHVFGSGYLHF